MSQEGERLHRPEPAREQPIRDFPHYARSHGLGGRPEDPVARGVKLGYSVLDEQMREGQRLAERLRGAPRAGAASLDVGGFVERALNLYRDMGALAMAATEALARNPGFGAARPEPAAAAYALDVKSARRVTVKFDLRTTPRGARLGPLTAPLTGATIAGASLDAEAATLKLDVADDQPAGVYNAVVVDAEGEAIGTLTVRLAA